MISENGKNASEPHKTRRLVAFGEFAFDTDDRVLWRGEEIVSLPPKTCELLGVFVENAGRLLTKEQLMNSVWEGTFVEEANLSHHIAVLRKSLGETRSAQKFIETIPRKGYRFVAPIDQPVSTDPLEITFSESKTTQVYDEIEIETASEGSPAKRLPGSVPSASRLAKVVLPVAACTVLLLGGVIYWATVREKQSVAVARLVPVTRYTGHEISPSISPDGKLVTYAGMNTSTSDHQPNTPESPPDYNIYVKQVDGESVLQLTNKVGTAMSPRWSPDGRFIAYAFRAKKGVVEKNILYLIPSLGGEEQKIYEAPHMEALAWSPDGKTLAFSAQENEGSPKNLYTISLETREVRQITYPNSGDDLYSGFSPDGKLFSFVRVKNKTSEIFVVPTDGGEPQQITHDNHFILGRAAWTPDGKHLVFASNRTGTYRLWKIPASGGEPQLLGGAGDPAYDPTISVDGKRLTYVRQEIDINVWRVPVENGRGAPERAEKVIASFRQDRCPAISPDGTRISFVSNQSGGARQVWMANADGTRQRQLTNFPDGSIATRTMWSPDSTHLVFDATETAGNSAIYTLNVESGVPRKLTPEGSSDALAPSWSSDGQAIYFAQKRDDQWQVWRVPASGGDPVQVTTNGGYEARESSDGKFLYFNKGGYGALGIFRQPTDGGSGEEKVFDLLQVDSVGEWTLTDAGIYYLQREDIPDLPSKDPRIRFFDFAEKKASDILRLAHHPWGHPGLDISRDGEWLYYSFDDKTDIDIMMVENFE